MTALDILRGFFALLFAGMLVGIIYMRRKNVVFTLSENTEVIKYRPVIEPYYMMLMMGALLVICLLTPDLRGSIPDLASMFFTVFIHTSLYFCVLLVLMPLLRRYISSLICGTLWLLPNLLYISVYGFMAPEKPLLVLKISRHTALIAAAIWAAGFLAVMIWKTTGHLMYRRHLLKGSRTVEYSFSEDQAGKNDAILGLWWNIQHEAGITKKYYPLVISPNAVTPLSIGLFRKSVRVILPSREYSLADLELILRHELVHICREDCWTKVFLVLCTAICWFNPLMWTAMKHSADDLELSCDETVLEGMDDSARQRYAQLILSCAGDGRGYTTCLSASASALRYRLKNIVAPRKRFLGSITAGIFLFLLLITSGYGVLAVGEGTAGERIFSDGAKFSDSPLQTVSFMTDGPYSSYECTDPEALTDYLSQLRLYKIGQSYAFSEDEHSIVVFYTIDGVNTGICLKDHSLSMTPMGSAANGGDKWYIDGGVDWDHILSLMTPCQPVSFVIDPPEMMISFGDPGSEPLIAESAILSIRCDGEEIERPDWVKLSRRIFRL